MKFSLCTWALIILTQCAAVDEPPRTPVAWIQCALGLTGRVSAIKGRAPVAGIVLGLRRSLRCGCCPNAAGGPWTANPTDDASRVCEAWAYLVYVLVEMIQPQERLWDEWIMEAGVPTWRFYEPLHFCHTADGIPGSTVLFGG